MFKTAELHRDALVRVLGLRGGGDVLRGLQSTVPWTIKAIQWFVPKEVPIYVFIHTYRVQVRDHGRHATR